MKPRVKPQTLADVKLRRLCFLAAVLLLAGCGANSASTWTLVAQVPSERYAQLAGGGVRVTLRVYDGRTQTVTIALANTDGPGSEVLVLDDWQVGKAYSHDVGVLPAGRYRVAVYAAFPDQYPLRYVVEIFERKP